MKISFKKHPHQLHSIFKIGSQLVLLILLLLLGISGYAQTAPELEYTFTTGMEGWVIDNENDGIIASYLPTHVDPNDPGYSSATSINGCPVTAYPVSPDGAFIIADDQQGKDMWMQSPELGGLNKSSMLDAAAIQFQLLNYAYMGGSYPDVKLELVLVGGGTTSVYSGGILVTPSAQWYSVKVFLSIDNFDINLPTVLASLDRLELRAEYISGLNDANCSTTEYAGIDTVGLRYVPVANDVILYTGINEPVQIKTQDLGYSHGLNNPMDHITINTLPLDGTLFLDANGDGMYTSGEQIAANTQISKADLDAGKLLFVPDLDEEGLYYASFDFTVSDATVDSPESNTVDIHVIPDTDGDGIYDRFDLDDDNDGILDGPEGCSGLRTIPGANGTTATDIADVNSPERAIDGVDGNSFAEMSSDGATLEIELRGGDFVMSHTNITIVADSDRNTNKMIITESSDGTTFLNPLEYELVENTWTNYIHELSMYATHIRIQYVRDGGKLWVDNVSYDAFQLECLPRDTDGDTIPDHLDLDSDNDGISDSYESGFANPENDLNNDGTISIAEAEAVLGANNADMDDDGLMDIFDANTSDATAAASVGTTPAESADDADTIPNYLDLDSDGDAIPDAVEAQLTVGYFTAFGGDADATDEDTDGDGVRNMYDSFTGYGGTFNIPQNTDRTDTFDYLDLDSDNDETSDYDENGFEVTTAPTYLDPNGSVNDPTLLTDDNTGTPEINYREGELIRNFMRHGKHFQNGEQKHMYFGNGR